MSFSPSPRTLSFSSLWNEMKKLDLRENLVYGSTSSLTSSPSSRSEGRGESDESFSFCSLTFSSSLLVSAASVRVALELVLVRAEGEGTIDIAPVLGERRERIKRWVCCGGR